MPLRTEKLWFHFIAYVGWKSTTMKSIHVTKYPLYWTLGDPVDVYIQSWIAFNPFCFYHETEYLLQRLRRNICISATRKMNWNRTRISCPRGFPSGERRHRKEAIWKTSHGVLRLRKCYFACHKKHPRWRDFTLRAGCDPSMPQLVYFLWYWNPVWTYRSIIVHCHAWRYYLGGSITNASTASNVSIFSPTISQSSLSPPKQ